MGEQVSASYIAAGLNKHGRVFLPFSGILSVLCVPPRRTLRWIASHFAKQLRISKYSPTWELSRREKRTLRLARKSRFLTARQEPGRAKKAPGGNGIPGGQRIPLRFRERLDVSFRGLPCRGTICQNVVSSSQAVDKTAASIRANRHRLAVRENQASLPCRLVREATTRRHPSDERNGNKARFRPAPVRVALLVTTIGGRYEIHAAGSSAFFLSYEISQFTISPEAALVNSFHALA